MKRGRFIWLFAAAFLAGVSRAQALGTSASFEFTQAGRQVIVRYFLPEEGAADAPVVFVLHGVKRNGEDYFNDWRPHAQKRGFVLIAPEFSQASFPGDEGYIYGNTVDRQGRPLPRAAWSFSMIEPIFAAVRERAGLHAQDYAIFGHSAGAQFVQRFLYFVPEAHVSQAIAANAGWYMLPDLHVRFPYGVGGTPVTQDALNQAFARRLVILLGTADTDPKHRVLRHTPEADAQGPHRFARGQYFFARAREAAAAAKVPFAWRLVPVPGVAHSERGMTPAALKLLLPEKR